MSNHGKKQNNASNHFCRSFLWPRNEFVQTVRAVDCVGDFCFKLGIIAMEHQQKVNDIDVLVLWDSLANIVLWDGKFCDQ